MSAELSLPLDERPVAPPRGRKRRLLAWAGSIAAHLMVFGALFWPHAANPSKEPQAIPVNLVQDPRSDVPGAPGPPGPAAMVKAAALQPAMPAHVIMPTLHIPTPARPARSTPVREAENAPAPDDFSDVMSDSELAGAASAGEGEAGGAGGGGGGGGCDMARAVQQALRRDPLVRNAVSEANRRGKSIMLWNGDWVRAGVQDGKGLSAVREAVMWEVAFAPEACRNRPVHGLILLSLADGGTRFAIGSGAWRWSDLLGVRR